jgi:hypothetical protein
LLEQQAKEAEREKGLWKVTVSVVLKIKILFKKQECSAWGIKQAVPLGSQGKHQ